jgi:hypothetical protein
MPAKAGIQYAAAFEILAADALGYWVPAFAGTTAEANHFPSFFFL